MNKTEKISLLEKRLGYTFKDPRLLQRSLTHKSAHHRNNERLEFLGDAVLNIVVADLLYQQFDEATEGQLTRARASLVNKSALSKIALALSLDQHIELGMGEKRSGGFRRESILADAFEAILGALYLDGGFENVYRVIQQHYQADLLAIRLDAQKKDPKTELQEWLQAQHHPLPIYHITAIEGEPHEQRFVVTCEVEVLSLKIEGSGASRRIAEQEAARKVLEQLK